MSSNGREEYVLSNLRAAFRSQDFSLTGELELSPGISTDELLDQARALADVTDAIQIPDHQHALPHMSNIAVAAHLLQNDMEPIVHLNCRDRNRIAIQSDLLGARSLGVTNFMLLRGAALPPNHRPRSTSVFDMSAIDLVATATAIGEGQVLTGGRAIGDAGFYIGTAATAFHPKDSWHPEKLLAKADAGAHFIQLQICMDVELLRAYLAKLIEARLTWRLQVLVSIAVFPSADVARKLRELKPATVIPTPLVKRLEQATDPEQEGVLIAAELLNELADVPGISGANVSTPGDPATIVAAIRESGVR